MEFMLPGMHGLYKGIINFNEMDMIIDTVSMDMINDEGETALLQLYIT